MENLFITIEKSQADTPIISINFRENEVNIFLRDNTDLFYFAEELANKIKEYLNYDSLSDTIIDEEN